MATRHARSNERPRRRRWAVFSAALLVILGLLAWFAPGVLVLTELRDRPLQAIFAGIDGRVSSRAASWPWWGVIEYRDVVLRDRDDRPVVAVPRVVIERGVAALLYDPTDLGAVRLIGGEAVVEVRRGGSTIEDVIAPWLAAAAHTRSLPASFELEVVDAAIELVDLDRQDAWRISDIVAAGTVRPDATLAGWTISGRAWRAAAAVRDLAVAGNRAASERVAVGARANGPPAGAAAAGATSREPPPSRLDRTTVAAGATAILARDGGWSVSSPDGHGTGRSRSLAVAATRFPLGISSVAATRFDGPQLLEGVADVRLDVTLPPPADPSHGHPPAATASVAGGTGVRVAGVVSVAELELRRAEDRAALLAIARAEAPLDVSLEPERITVRSLKATSPVFRGEVSGRLRLSRGGAWDWAEAIASEDFAIAADIDLAAAAAAVAGGLAVRPDVRITGGFVQLSAVARPDGNDRVLELRASSRDVAAVQSVAPGVSGGALAAAAGNRGGDASRTRLLRWSEPFTAWARGRRGGGRGERLRIEEARIASSAVEVSAAGSVEASEVQWTLDMDALMADVAEVLDLDGLTLRGTAGGRLALERVAATGGYSVRGSAGVSNLELLLPGGKPWRDAEIAITAEAAGGIAGTAVVVDQGHVRVAAGEDTLAMTLTGGVLLDPWAIFRGRSWSAAAWGRPASATQGIAVDVSFAGDLSRWQPRWQVLGGVTDGNGIDVTGFAKASASIAADGGSWQVTRAGCELEKLSVAIGDRRIQEPRGVLTAAGRWHPESGTVDVASAELLTPTLSLRTGGLTLLPAGRPSERTGAAQAAARLRGRLQWQADLARLERWLVPADTAARWPTGGRVWGTAEVLDTPLGLNLLVEATGSQLTLSAGPGGAAAASQAVPLWTEPQATLTLEVTCPPAGAAARMTVNRLAVDSSTLAIAAAGTVLEPSSRWMVDLGGNVACDWDQVTRLVSPWTGGRVRLSGTGARPFTIRGPLGPPGTTSHRGPQTVEQLTLPDDWLPGGARAAETAEKVARVSIPATPAGRGSGGLAARLRAVAVDTSAAWSAADMAGFQVAAGEMPVRLVEGQLALGPFDLAASGGRIRGAPWFKLSPGPVELIVPPGRCIDRVVLSPQMCDRWVTWLVPLIGHSTHTQGLVSIDLAGGRLPMGDPFGGEASGQLIFENLEATPGDEVRPLVNLIVKLQSAIDPRFAFGDKTVLMRVRPEPVRIRLADRRLWHDGLVIDSGQLTIRSAGSVGADGSLAMVVELAFRGDIAGATPVIGQLLRTPLTIPLTGTVRRPQFDARAVDRIIGRIMENTAEALIGPKLSRDLEALFGNPQPAEAAEPLAFPQPAR